jgi:hypothetical protein
MPRSNLLSLNGRNRVKKPELGQAVPGRLFRYLPNRSADDLLFRRPQFDRLQPIDIHRNDRVRSIAITASNRL